MAAPFRVEVSKEILDDLATRLRATRFLPGDRDDWTAGANPSYLRELVAYWRDRFDWRAQEDLLNRFHHFRGDVDGTQLHFIHEKGRGPRPLPLILTHG